MDRVTVGGVVGRRVYMDRNEQVGVILVGDSRSVVKRDESVVGSCHDYLDSRICRPDLVPQLEGYRQSDILFPGLLAVTTHAAGVMAAVTRVDTYRL